MILRPKCKEQCDEAIDLPCVESRRGCVVEIKLGNTQTYCIPLLCSQLVVEQKITCEGDGKHTPARSV